MERSRTTSAILGSVHHISAKFPNVALFLRLGLSSKQILHENGAFRKCFTNWRNLEAFRFGVYGKHFKNGAFLKRWRHNDHVTSPDRVHQTQIQNDR